MLPFGVTVPATVPQRSEILEGLVNYSVYIDLMVSLSKTKEMKIRKQKDIFEKKKLGIR